VPGHTGWWQKVIRIMCNEEEKELLQTLFRFAEFCLLGVACIFKQEVHHFNYRDIKWIMEDKKDE